MLWTSQGSLAVIIEFLFLQALMMMLLNLNAAIRSRFNESILLNDPYN
jgi:hypothetical protein